MRYSHIATLAAFLGGATARPHHHEGKHDQQDKDIPALHVEDWQRVKSMAWAGVEGTVKMADDFVEGIIDIIEAQDVETTDDDGTKTIWQLLNEDKDRYSKIIKAINIDGGAREILDDQKTSITFFAPEDSGIPTPHKHHDDDEDKVDFLSSYDTAFDHLLIEPTLDNILHVHDLHGQKLFARDENEDKKKHRDDDDDDDKKKRKHRKGDEKDDDEKKKRIFKFILKQVLKYHGLPQALSAEELAANNTVATALVFPFGANDDQPQRIRVEKQLVPPTLKLNKYAKVVVTQSNRKAINGYLHEIDHPLLPLPSVFDELFFARELDTFTTAIQRVGGAGAIAWEFSGALSKEAHHPVFVGSPAITAFVPTTAAFEKLPRKLKFFLFSPFGKDVLRKVLSYHILDKYVVFSENIHKVGKHGNEEPHKHKHHKHDDDDHKHKHKKHDDDDHKHKHKKGDKEKRKHDKKHEKKGWFQDEAEAMWQAMSEDDNSFHLERKFPTLLSNGTLDIVIDKSKVLPIGGATKTTVSVNGVLAEEFDLPALNGVFHVLPEVLKPPHKHEDEEGNLVEGTWENWESWLMDWAESA